MLDLGFYYLKPLRISGSFFYWVLPLLKNSVVSMIVGPLFLDCLKVFFFCLLYSSFIFVKLSLYLRSLSSFLFNYAWLTGGFFSTGFSLGWGLGSGFFWTVSGFFLKMLNMLSFSDCSVGFFYSRRPSKLSIKMAIWKYFKHSNKTRIYIQIIIRGTYHYIHTNLGFTFKFVQE